MKFNIYFIILSSLVLNIFAANAIAGVMEMKDYRSNTLGLHVETQYFSSNKNYSDSGSSGALTFSNSYSLVQVPFGVRYVGTHQFGFRLGSETSYATSKNSDPLYRGDRTNSTLDELSTGIDYLFWDMSGWQFIADFDARFGLVRFDNTTDNVMTHEGTNFFTPNLVVQKAFDNFELMGNVGYSMRSGRSNQLPWAAQGVFTMNKVAVGGEISGAQSVSDDPDKGNTTNERARLGAVNRANGGSCRFYCLNPSHTDLTGLVRYHADDWTFTAYGGATLMGNNYSDGYFLGATLTVLTDFGGNSGAYSTPTETKTSSPTDTTFQPSTHDGVDQSVFTETEPEWVKNNTAKKNARKNKGKKSAPPPPPAAETQKSVQDQLNEAEMTIQLKRKKKK